MRQVQLVSKAPLAVAGIVSTPLFFTGLISASLAIERADVRAQWRNGKGTLITVFDDPTAWTEAKIWLLALGAVAIVLAAGVVGMYFRGGILLVALTGTLVPAGIRLRLDRWTEHHTERFPYGVDLVHDASTSNVLLRGEWEESAHKAASQLGWATLGLAAAAAVIWIVLDVRRRRALAAAAAHTQQ